MINTLVELVLVWSLLSCSLIIPVFLFFALDGIVLDGYFADKLKRRLNIRIDE